MDDNEPLPILTLSLPEHVDRMWTVCDHHMICVAHDQWSKSLSLLYLYWCYTRMRRSCSRRSILDQGFQWLIILLIFSISSIDKLVTSVSSGIKVFSEESDRSACDLLDPLLPSCPLLLEFGQPCNFQHLSLSVPFWDSITFPFFFFSFLTSSTFILSKFLWE